VYKGIQFAKSIHAIVTGFHAIQPFHIFPWQTAMLEDTREQLDKGARAHAERGLAALQQAAAEAGVPCDGIVNLMQKIARLCSKERTTYGLVRARISVFSPLTHPQISLKDRRLAAIFDKLTMPSGEGLLRVRTWATGVGGPEGFSAPHERVESDGKRFR